MTAARPARPAPGRGPPNAPSLSRGPRGRPSSDPAPRRLDAAFGAGREGERALFIPFLTHGFPRPAATPRLLERLAEQGADVIELGVPFSDPLADGPVIQRASHQALRQGVTLESTLRLAAEMASGLPPLVLFTYLNPALRFGLRRFAERAAEAGAAGILVTDLPVGADPEREAELARAGPHFIRLAAPTTTPDRLGLVARAGSGFLYYISRTGVTGERTAVTGGLEEEVAAVRRHAGLPVVVGFGIGEEGAARRVARVADGVVAGSALIEALSESEERFVELAGRLAGAVHDARAAS